MIVEGIGNLMIPSFTYNRMSSGVNGLCYSRSPFFNYYLGVVGASSYVSVHTPPASRGREVFQFNDKVRNKENEEKAGLLTDILCLSCHTQSQALRCQL
jgi:hypothetical protein